MIKIRGLDSQFPNVLKATYAAVDSGTQEFTIEFPEIETDMVSPSDVQTAFAAEVKQMWATGRPLTLISDIDVEVDGGNNYLQIYFCIPITLILQGVIFGAGTMMLNNTPTPVAVELNIKRINNGDGTYTFYPEVTFHTSNNQ